MPKIDPEWDDRGIDTTQPGWYRKHPFWRHIAVPFRQECDRIVAQLQDSLPKPGVSRDTVVLQYKGALERGLRYPGLTYPFKGMGLILRPQLLRATPKSSPVTALIRPEEGPWRVLSLFNCKDNACEYPMAESDLGQPKKWKKNENLSWPGLDFLYDRSNEVAAVAQVFHHTKWGLMELPHPDAMGLVSTRSGQPLGWISLDSMAIFPDSADALVTAPFYRDGIATFMHGAWKEEAKSHSERCTDYATDPMDHFGHLHVYDMIHRWRIILEAKFLYMMRSEDLPSAALRCRRLMRQNRFECSGDKPISGISKGCMEKQKWDTLTLSEYYVNSGWMRFERLDLIRMTCAAKIGVLGKGCSISMGFNVRGDLFQWLDAEINTDGSRVGIGNSRFNTVFVP